MLSAICLSPLRLCFCRVCEPVCTLFRVCRPACGAYKLCRVIVDAVSGVVVDLAVGLGWGLACCLVYGSSAVRAALVCDDTGQELNSMPDLYPHTPLMQDCIDAFPHMASPPALSPSGSRLASRFMPLSAVCCLLPVVLQRCACEKADVQAANAPTHIAGSEDTAAGAAARAVPVGAGGVVGSSKNGCRCDTCQECLLAGALESLGEGDSNPCSVPPSVCR